MRKGDVIEQMAGQMTIFDFISGSLLHTPDNSVVKKCYKCNEFHEAVGGGRYCFIDVISRSSDPEYCCEDWKPMEDDDEP